MIGYEGHAEGDLSEPIYAKGKAEEARQFVGIAHGHLTRIDRHHATYLGQQNTTRRTQADDERAIAQLIAWCTSSGVPAYIEAVTKKCAGQFMDALLTMGNTRSPVTLNKYLRRLSVYWDWLVQRDYAPINVWKGMVLKEPKRLKEDLERPFSEGEMKALLAGPASQAMHDVMRIAALTGARLDAIVCLTVEGCAGGFFCFKPQKKEVDTRQVPIHPTLKDMIARRSDGKAPADPLFPEWPAPSKANSKRERSFKTSNEFTSYRRSVGVADEREDRRRSLVNFHSFRRWFITMAERADIPESTLRAVVGHKRDGMTLGLYSQGPSLEQMRLCVEAVNLPDVDHVVVLPEVERRKRSLKTEGVLSSQAQKRPTPRRRRGKPKVRGG